MLRECSRRALIPSLVLLATGNNAYVAAVAQPMVYMADSGTVQLQPVAGQQFITVGGGEVIDVIIQNLPANANGACVMGASMFL